jgi:dTDP-4-dehydrorhamnose 3,5-epimerase
MVTPSPVADERGSFMRTFCAETFGAAGLPRDFPQCNVSRNTRRGTLRGLHWQADPYPEGKLVRCTRGTVFDVAVDVRPGSSTHGRFVALELEAGSGVALYIGPGFAHGFQALTDDAEVFYHMSEAYRPGLARGVRFDDPTIGIPWPLPDPILSERDRQLPLLAAL